MKIRFIILTLFIFIFVLPMPALAAETDSGRIEGWVFNATGDINVTDQEVTLKTYLNNSEMESKIARTDAKGLFVFQGLSTRKGYSYDVTTNFQEADYTSDKVDFEDGVTAKSVKINVYDATTNPELIKVDTAHTIIYAGADGLQVKSYAMVNNGSNLTYIGSKQLAPDKKETLKFSLPEGAREPQYGLSLMECCVIPGDGIISDTMPVLPGSKEIAYTYIIPYDSSVYTFAQEFEYPTARFDLLIEGDSARVAGDKLTPEQPVTIEGKQFSRLSTQDIAAGDAIKIELSGLPTGGRQNIQKGVIIGLVTLVSGGGLFYLARRRKAQPVPVPVKGGNSPVQEKRKLLAELAHLDDNYEAGRMAEDVYRRQRAIKKKQLLLIMQALK